MAVPYNLKLSVDNDLVIGRGARRTSGLEYTAQLVRNRLSTILNEWELDPTVGLPWLLVLERNADIGALRMQVSNVILSTPHVRNIETLTMVTDKTARKLTINFVANSDWGQLDEAFVYGGDL
jgi:hypothetical protein